MAKKETGKKKASKKLVDKKNIVKEFVEKINDSQNQENINVEQDPPIEQEFINETIESLTATAEPFIAYKESEYEPTLKADELEKFVEIMNGDPSVIIPSNDIELKKEETIEEAAFNDTFKNVKLENKRNNRIDRTFGYSWNGVEIDF